MQKQDIKNAQTTENWGQSFWSYSGNELVIYNQDQLSIKF